MAGWLAGWLADSIHSFVGVKLLTNPFQLALGRGKDGWDLICICVSHKHSMSLIWDYSEENENRINKITIDFQNHTKRKIQRKAGNENEYWEHQMPRSYSILVSFSFCNLKSFSVIFYWDLIVSALVYQRVKLNSWKRLEELSQSFFCILYHFQ